VVEPGTPKGWQRILAARSRLIENGDHTIAPCPHRDACPISVPDWCHFSRRVARSRIHRRAKDADVPWDD
jgi:ribosomal protein RSM22 (predicted rRNA methylase)